MLRNRQLTSLLDRLHPDLNTEMRHKKEKEVERNKRLKISMKIILFAFRTTLI